MVAAKIANMPHGGDRVSEQARNYTLAPVTDAQAAAALNVSVDSVRKAKKLRREAPPEVIKAVEDGKLPINAAKKAVHTVRMTKVGKAPTKRMTKADPSRQLIEEDKLTAELKCEAIVASIKADLTALDSMVRYADQHSTEFRQSLADELNGIEKHAGIIAKKMLTDCADGPEII
jgi:hypothetical protein